MSVPGDRPWSQTQMMRRRGTVPRSGPRCAADGHYTIIQFRFASELNKLDQETRENCG